MKRRDFLKSIVGAIGCMAALAKADSKPKRVARINVPDVECLRHKIPFSCTSIEREESRQAFLQAHDISFVGRFRRSRGFWESKTTGQRYDAIDYGLIYHFTPDGKIEEEYLLTEWVPIT